MFSYEEIQKYSETDIRIYKYIVSDIDKIQYMTIRELAKELQVSTPTILRFCNKNNFDGYSEFKEALKKKLLYKPHIRLWKICRNFLIFLQEQIQVPLRENYCLRLAFLEKLI